MPRAARGRPIGLDDLECTNPTWTPNGTRIVFEGRLDGESRIYAIGLDGLAPVPVTDGPTDGDPAVSPDGARLAFTRGNGEIVIGHTGAAGGAGPTTIPAGGFRYEWPAWSPDGRRLAVWSNRDLGDDIWTVENDDARSMTKLTDSAAADIHPAWSPDGGKLAFASDRDGPFGIYVMEADGSDARRIAPGHGRAPAWSPDGSRIAFEGTEEPQSSRGPLPVTICILTVATGELEMLMSASLGHSPAWSLDGKRIAYTHNYSIMILDLATKDVRPLAKGVPA